MSEAIQIDTRSEETKAEDAKAETQIENFVPPTPTQEVAEPPAETPPPAKQKPGRKPRVAPVKAVKIQEPAPTPPPAEEPKPEPPKSESPPQEKTKAIARPVPFNAPVNPWSVLRNQRLARLQYILGSLDQVQRDRKRQRMF